MISEEEHSNPAVTQDIHALVQAAYREESKVIGIKDFPPLRETMAGLQRSTDQFVIYRRFGVIVGAISFACAKGMVTVTRLVVNPQHFRQGIATALLTEIERLFPESVTFRVSTAAANIPAIRLYERAGYALSGTSNTPEGIVLNHFTKR